MERTLFRILQEGLNNVYRHSKSATAEVSLSLSAQSVTLEIKDAGKGMPPQTLEAARGGGTGLVSGSGCEG